MENIISFNAENRTETGKKIAKQLRNAGKIPAIIYGGNKESIAIAINVSDIKDLMKTEKKGNNVLRFHRGDVTVDAMLKELQWDYLSDNIIHADFVRVNLEETIDVSIPVKLLGTPVGVKVEDGILDFVTREVEIRCLPADIPSKVEVNVEDLHAGDSIKVSDLNLGEKISFLSSEDGVICTVTGKVGSEEDEEEGEETTEE
jgi:large subunit ribosomal protein L25